MEMSMGTLKYVSNVLVVLLLSTEINLQAHFIPLPGDQRR